MKRYHKNRKCFWISVLLAGTVWIMAGLLSAWRAPALAQEPDYSVKQVRISQSAERVRIVLDVANIPQYTITREEEPPCLKIKISGAKNQSGAPAITFQNPLATQLQLLPVDGGLEVVIHLKSSVMPKLFTLGNPNRLVIDLVADYAGVPDTIVKENGKTGEEREKGIVYSLWHSAVEPLRAHILTVNPREGYTLWPALSNEMVAGLETLSGMTQRCQAVAAVNASYFEPDGSIIGLLKVDGRIISTPYQARAGLAIFSQEHFAIDRLSYEGWVELPNDQKITIGGVNRERGADELILYNSGFGPATGTNRYGREWIIRGDVVVGCNPANSPLPPSVQVLSAHGAALQAMNGLKTGDRVNIRQSLGDPWDQAIHVVGAGPLLLKNGEICLAAADEEFGPDVAVGRAPRTALGLLGDGRVLLVVVDGRQRFSRGMTLLELANFMKDLGAVDAMNLDGGGSSEMIVRGRVVNSPSDGRERRIGDALVIVPVSVSAN